MYCKPTPIGGQLVLSTKGGEEMSQSKIVISILVIMVLPLMVPFVSAFDFDPGGGAPDLTLTAPRIVNGPTSFTITAKTSTTDATIRIYVDGTLKKTGTSPSVQYTVPNQGVRLYTIKAVVTKGYQSTTDTKYTMVRWSPSRNSANWGTDAARHPNSLDVQKIAEKVLDFGIHTLGYSNARTSKKYAILSLDGFARHILKPNWASDDDACSDKDVIKYLKSWNGISSSYTTTRHFDCRDFAAVITGIAMSMGLSARMISVESGSFRHVVPVIYGISHTYETGKSNNGWFLIDRIPSIDFNGYASASTIEGHYTIGTIQYRFHWIDGFTSDGWGVGVSHYNQQTGWLATSTNGLDGEGNQVRMYSDPPIISYYSNNPYGITV